VLTVIGKEHLDLHGSVLNDRRLYSTGIEDKRWLASRIPECPSGLRGVSDPKTSHGGDADQASFNPPGPVFGIGTGRQPHESRLVDEPGGHSQAPDMMSGSRKSPKHSAPRRTASGGGVGSGVGSSLRGSRPCAAAWPRGRPSPRLLGSIGCLGRLSSSAPPTASFGAPRRGSPCLGTLCGLRADGIHRRVGVVRGPAGPRDFPEKRSERFLSHPLRKMKDRG
jgi:hypothetical protein